MLGNKIAVLIDEFDFSDGFFAAETEHTVEEKDNTTFGALATSAEPGLASDKFMLRGYFSGYQVGKIFCELRDRLGAAGLNTPMAILIDTDNPVCVAECSANGFGQALKINLATSELITFELNTAAGGMQTGARIFDSVVSATGNQPAVDVNTSGLKGGGVLVFVQSITGTATNAQVKIQSSAMEVGTYVDKATLNFSAIGGYFVAIVGTVNRWLRVNVVGMGGATAFRLVVVAYIN